MSDFGDRDDNGWDGFDLPGWDDHDQAPFLWRTQDGEVLTPEEMTTSHLFYVVRMIWNHCCPANLRMPGGHWEDAERWPAQTKIEILRVMGAELATRTDLPVALDVQLGIMRDRCRNFCPGLLLGPGVQ